MRRQAERWGAEMYQEDIEYVDVKNSPFTVKSSERKVIHCFAAFSSFVNFLMKWLHNIETHFI